ncbi:TMV resistance protein N [Morella rubra]|uniref:TMV resistance protein N n=1 Tax=Morella rubra TaxID=262757 RepID=A0A6A1UKT1_9ROSI|nr:TMV resistance protein N [Morella rubra]
MASSMASSLGNSSASSMASQGDSSASSMASQGDSSASSSTDPCAYDVFLSFRGEDTRNNFTAHLHDALDRKGIKAYIDDELRRGEEISPALYEAIEESKISVIVLSKNYPSSTWCLDELVKILECKDTKQQLVLPVFYNVDPSEVRHHRGNIGKALSKLEQRFKDGMKLQRWKAALKEVANLSGFRLGNTNWNECRLIHEIVQEVSRMVNHTYLNVATYPVGIKSRVQDVSSLLCIGTNSIRMIGIYGVGGIGKTTIAKAIYNLIAHQFEASCFLANIRETSNQACGLVRLQETLLYEILGDSSTKVGNVDRGINLIKHRLCSKRVLLVLDDVDQLVQLEALAGERGWFGVGSRVIITTRDQHLLANHQVNLTYEVKELDHNEALQLFRWSAFNSNKSIDGYVDLIEHVIHYAGGLPLALTVLGSDLYGRSLHEWKNALDKYKRIPHANIQEVLRISYDGLDQNEKDIFLDIACFFKGEPKDYVTKILDNCGFFPDIGIRKLVDKCLITIDEFNKLQMHDLLLDMGREIVRQESPKDPGRRSRLWFHEDVRDVLEENMGTNQIEGILVDFPEGDLICIHPEVFVEMKNLRLFINRNAIFSGGPRHLPNNLRVLDWPEYPLLSLPSNFRGKKLCSFSMPNSLLKELGEGFKNFQNLTAMDFSGCELLTKVPDLSRSPNMEKLIFDNCTSLVEVHHSVGFLNKLNYLSFEECSNLTSFPSSLRLRSLEFLCLQGCSSLQNFPEIECQMEQLRYVNFRYSGIKELPTSLGNLGMLLQLNLVGYGLVSLALKEDLEGGTDYDDSRLMVENVMQRFRTFPGCDYETLSSEDIISFLPSNNPAPIKPSSVRVFSLENCILLESSPSTIIQGFSMLEQLNLSNTDIVSLPTVIQTFSGLKVLTLKNCKELKEIRELPPSIQRVYASGCISLENFPAVSNILKSISCDIQALEWIDLSGCHKMVANIRNHVENPLLGEGHYYLGGTIVYPGNKLPDWIRHRKDFTSISKSCEVNINGPLHWDDIRGIVFVLLLAPLSECTTKLSPLILFGFISVVGVYAGIFTIHYV